MEVIPIVSLKSAGATTAALALASVWPERRPAPVVLECDPAGGDIAARFDLSLTPGLVSLALAMDRAGDVEEGRGVDPHLHSQPLPGRRERPAVHVVVAPTSPDEMRRPLALLSEKLPLLAQTDGDILLDCGRLETASMQGRTPTIRLLQRAGLAIVVVRPQLSELQRLAVWLPVLRSGHVEAVALLSQRGPYSESEIADTLEVEVIGSLPDDAVSAGVVGAGAAGPRPDRLPLLRAARTIAAALASRLATVGRPDRIGESALGTVVPLVEGAR